MTIRDLSEQQREAQAMYRAFVEEEVVPHIACYETEEQLPRELIGRMGELGFLGAAIPKAYGGSETDMITYGLLNEALGRGSSSVRGLMMLQNMVGHTVARWGSVQQKELWPSKIAAGDTVVSLALTEAQAGTDIKAVATEAAREGDDYLLNGQKCWITCAQIADLFLVLARLEGQLSAFLVERDTPGLSVEPITGMSGVRATMLGNVHFHNCRIPAENLVGAPGFGLAPVTFTALDLGRYSIAWGCVGIAQACLDACLKHTSERKQFGVYLREHQLIQQKITDMVVNVKAARLLCMQAGVMRDARDADAFVETMIAKYFASTVATRVANDAVQIHGAAGLHDSHPVQRHLRDAKTMEIIEGTTEIHQIKIAEYSYRSAATL